MDNQHSKPDLPAQKGWEQMKELLEKEMPANTVHPNNSIRRYSVLLLLLMIGSCGIYKMYFAGHQKDLAMNSKADTLYTKKSDVTLLQNYSVTPGMTNDSGAVKETNKPTPGIVEAFDNANATNVPTTSKNNEENALRKHGVADANTKSISQSDPSQSQDKITANKRTVSNLATHSALINATITPLNNGNKFAEDAKKDVVANNYSLQQGNNKNITSNPVSLSIQNTPVIANKNTPSTAIIPSSNDTNTAQIISINDGRASQTKIAKSSPDKGRKDFHIGLEWAVTAFTNNTVFKEGNAQNRPLTALIPAIWISRKIAKKSTIYLSLNPYAQYFLGKNATVQSGNYTINAVGASTISQPPAPTYLAQTFSVNKIMGVEVALQYARQLSTKWSAGLAVGNTWTNTALLNEKVIKNKTTVIKDSLYGVIKTDKDWQYINKNFLTAKANLAYRFKYFQVGVSLSKSLTDIYRPTDGKAKSPLNTQLFFRLALQ